MAKKKSSVKKKAKPKFKQQRNRALLGLDGPTTGRFRASDKDISKGNDQRWNFINDRFDFDDMSEGEQALLNEIENEENKFNDPFYDPADDYS